MHTLGKVKNGALAAGTRPSRRSGSGARPRWSRRRTGWSPTRPGGRPADRPVRRGPGPGGDREPRGGSRRLQARASRRAPGAGSGCPPTGPWCCFRRPGAAAEGARTWCCAPRPSWWRMTRRWRAGSLTLAFVGGPSGTGPGRPGRADRTGRRPGHRGPGAAGAAVPAGRTGRLVPGRHRGHGAVLFRVVRLVAVEAQACGTPVIAAAVGGLRTAVRDGSPACSWRVTTRRATPAHCAS